MNKHLATVSKRGPHRVLVGDLDYAGIPGKVYAPAEGKALPAVAFGHEWRKKVKHYHGTLRHLASWGFVVVAPDTETGFNPNHRSLAADLESALQIATGVRLGQGNITVSPHKLGLVGHGMGGGAAVLAAVDNPKVKAVATIYPAVTAPSNAQAARKLDIPGLVLGATKNELFSAGNAAKLAHNWGGQVAYRDLDKGNPKGFSEDTFYKLLFGIGAFQSGAIDLARGLTTGFLLSTVAGESKYDDFADPEAKGKKFHSYSDEELAEKAGAFRDE